MEARYSHSKAVAFSHPSWTNKSTVVNSEGGCETRMHVSTCKSGGRMVS